MISHVRKTWSVALASLVIYAGAPTQAAEISTANSSTNPGKSTLTDFAFSFACPPQAGAPVRHHRKRYHPAHLSHHIKIANKPFHHLVAKHHLVPQHPHHKHKHVFSDKVCMGNGSLGTIMAGLDAPNFPSTYTPNTPTTPSVPNTENGSDNSGDVGFYPGGDTGVVVITPPCDLFLPPPPCNGNAPTVPPQIGAVPEPKTWALLLLGFGAIGFTVRRTNSKKLSYRSLRL